MADNEIKDRLRQTTDACLSCYEVWDQDRKNSKNREDLLEAVHELRKVGARLEIEMAVSERDQMTNKPIPIPHHRSSKKRQLPKGEKSHDGGGNGGGSGGGGHEPNGNAVIVENAQPKRRGGGKPRKSTSS